MREKPEQKRTNKFDAVANDPTFSYFDGMKTEEIKNNKMREVAVSSGDDDDLEGFNMDKFRSANAGGKEV